MKKSTQRFMKRPTSSSVHKGTHPLLATAIFFLLFFLAGCKQNEEKRIAIWTASSEFAPYIEFFNETHSQKAILVYKENPASALSLRTDEQEADIVIGPWLKNEKTKKYFYPTNFIFRKKLLDASIFYPIFLKSGEFSKRQYLLPVSFNLPVMIFASENSELIANNYTITFDQIKSAGTAFNKQSKNGAYTRMGFALQSSNDFLYLATKIRGVDFAETKNGDFTWNEESLAETVDYLKEWISSSNGSVQTESDFVYKYLSESDDKRVTSGRTLFAYTTSDRLFQMPKNQLEKIDYRWIQMDDALPVEDSMIMLGIPRTSKNKPGAAEFISWFFDVQTQRALLTRTASMNLNLTKFGIADGFSSLKEVNDFILPSHYTKLLSNVPQSGQFILFERKPAHWEEIKRTVIIPYIKDAITTENNSRKILTIDERYTDWKKQLILP